MTQRLAAGLPVFTDEEALAALKITRRGFLKAAEREQKRHTLFNPRHGFYIAVPPQYLSWGAPPPAWYIDALMKHEGHPYYVGLLKAAELHGLPPGGDGIPSCYQQADTENSGGSFDVRVLLPPQYKTRHRSRLDDKTDMGSMRESSPELTAFDLLRYAHIVGTIDSIATVLSDFGKKMRPEKLAQLARAFQQTVV